jgi:hypothetical protein
MTITKAYVAAQVLACSDVLEAAVKGMGEEEQRYRPAPQEWHIHQIVTHLARIQHDRFVYCIDLALREPGAKIEVFDAGAHMAAVYDSKASMARLLSHFRAANERIAGLLNAATPRAVKNAVQHPRLGALPALWWGLHAYGHTHEHISQIISNRDMFLREHN